MKEMKSLKDLLCHEVQLLFVAEKLIASGLPPMILKAHDKDLKSAFKTHLDETKHHIFRLEQIAEQLEIPPEGSTNPSIKGLLEEGKKAMHKDAAPAVMDATLIACAQKIEHYEIAGYGTAAYLAEELDLKDIARVLRQTLDEEKKTDAILNKLAKTSINPKAEKLG